ncbi:hypothetical protein NDU88_002384 [Pleurodeles waltl]|uniref:Uncharacterized protein n=1 Tax=Pleurodeles waltl TaxID=8319 RepID=A0AAV7TN34_PLEWA|nr:hypothetical protein NDU88_002384 [Pleurodeles waltl]
MHGARPTSFVLLCPPSAGEVKRSMLAASCERGRSTLWLVPLAHKQAPALGAVNASVWDGDTVVEGTRAPCLVQAGCCRSAQMNTVRTKGGLPAKTCSGTTSRLRFLPPGGTLFGPSAGLITTRARVSQRGLQSPALHARGQLQLGHSRRPSTQQGLG